MIRIIDNFIFFDGDFLVPTYKTSIIYPNEKTPMLYTNSSLQCFEVAKALFFKDYDSIGNIMNCFISTDIISKGHAVQNYNKNVWHNKRYNIMLNIEMEKYFQNSTLMNKLLNSEYDDKIFCYCNPVDNYWGIGIGINNDDITNPDLWPGQNMYGKIIKDVRDSFKHRNNFIQLNFI